MSHHCKWGGFVSFRRLFCSAVQPNPAPSKAPRAWESSAFTRPELDFDFLLDDTNAALIEQNIRQRKGIGDLQRVRSLWSRLQCFPPFVDGADDGGPSAGDESVSATVQPNADTTTTTATGCTRVGVDQLRTLWDQFYAEADLLPNFTDPEAPIGDASAVRCVTEFGPPAAAENGGNGEAQKGTSNTVLYPLEEMVSGWHSLRFPRLGSGGRSYALIGSLANIEQALLDYSIDFLYERLQNDEKGIANVELIDVDDILPLSTTRACGVVQQRLDTSASFLQYRVFRANQLRFDDADAANCLHFDDHHQPSGHNSDAGTTAAAAAAADDDHHHHHHPPTQSAVAAVHRTNAGLCLSGTAEMGIAHRLRGRVFDEHELPTYFMAQSRCFRNELGANRQDSGLYRVHEFNKVELFVVCTERQSVAELGRIVRLQQSLYDSLQLRCRIMDMPSEELGASAARKFDLEAWMPGRDSWGELCSASNCTDFQARRLHLKYRPSPANNCDVHQHRPQRFVHTCNGTGLASTRAMIALLETHQTGLQKGVKLPEMIAQRLAAQRSAGIRLAQLKNSPRLMFD